MTSSGADCDVAALQLAEYTTTMQAAHLATCGTRLNGTRHSAHQVDVFDWAGGQDAPPLELLGYDNSGYGLGVTHADELALLVPGDGDARWTRELQVRDSLAGSVLRTLAEETTSPSGMTCGGALSAAPPKPPAPPPPIDPVTVQADCQVSSFDSGWSGTAEVHVVGDRGSSANARSKPSRSEPLGAKQTRPPPPGHRRPFPCRSRAAILRVLAPGGRALLVVQPMWRGASADDSERWRDTLSAALERAGFRDIVRARTELAPAPAVAAFGRRAA